MPIFVKNGNLEKNYLCKNDSMKILLLNGPNLNLLGNREPAIYGNTNMEQVMKELQQKYSDHTIEYFQSNTEGSIIDRLQQVDFEALIINPGAYTHYALAIADALRNLAVPKVEVHISNIFAREEFRQKSVTAPHCDGVITGFGIRGYALAVEALQLN